MSAKSKQRASGWGGMARFDFAEVRRAMKRNDVSACIVSMATRHSGAQRRKTPVPRVSESLQYRTVIEDLAVADRSRPPVYFGW